MNKERNENQQEILNQQGYTFVNKQNRCLRFCRNSQLTVEVDPIQSFNLQIKTNLLN